jgi:hypothetical protein
VKKTVHADGRVTVDDPSASVGAKPDDLVIVDVYFDALAKLCEVDVNASGTGEYQLYFVRPSHVNGDSQARAYGLTIAFARKDWVNGAR